MKIDMGEVKRNQESLNASIKAMKSQLQSAQVSLAKLANNKESLEGTVRTAIDAKIKYHQLPLLQNYESALDIMSKDYDAFITTFQSEVGESDSNAIINTDYLSELSAIFPGITQALSYIQRDTSSTYSDIADIISLTDPSTSVITTALTEAKQILTDTTNKMSSFNELGTPGTFSEMMGQQNSELATLSSIQGPNYTAPNILRVYQNSDFVSKVKDNMAKDPAQYKVQLQNELAKELVDNYYSKLPPEAPLQPYKVDAKTKNLIERANNGDLKAIDELSKQYDYHKALNSARHRSQAEINRSNAIFWEKSRQGLIHIVGEFTNYYNLIRLTRGIDPVTGEPANRFEAGVWLGVEVFVGIAKLNKLAKAANIVDKVSDTAKVANKLDDVGRVVGKTNDVHVAQEVLQTTNRFNESSIVDYAGKMNKKYTKTDIEKLTELTTHNADSPTALLGYFEGDSVYSYEQIAHANGFTYFDAGHDGWNAIAKVDPTLATAVNKEFLLKQIQEGKDFVLTSNPYKAKQLAEIGKGVSFANELDILEINGYKIESYGQFWRAYK